MLVAACAHAPPPAPEATPAGDTLRVEGRFYQNRPYGSEAEFNPFSILVNEGYDQLRTSEDRSLLTFPYRGAAIVVLHSLADPERVLRHYGYRRWLVNEMFPLTTKGEGGGQWYPNYTLHLFGAGMTYVRLTEWYEQHGMNWHPEVLAGVSAMAFHFLNEMIETGSNFIDDEDSLTDLMFFDTASIMLWNQEFMKRWFSGRVEFTDWQGQASVGFPGTTIEDAYSLVMLRVPLPRAGNWKVMTTLGDAFLMGVSRRVGRNYWVTASGGFDPADNPIIDPKTFTKTVDLTPNAGLFLDRDGSLLVSFISKGGSNNGPTLNIYPLGRSPLWPGIWLQQIRGGGLRYGIVSRAGVGLSTFTR